MEATQIDTNLRTIFPARCTEPFALAELGTDMWEVLKSAILGNCQLGNMRLICWRSMRELMGKRWADVGHNVETTTRQELEACLASGEACIRYNDLCLLLITVPSPESILNTLGSEIVPAIEAKIAGALSDGQLIEIWKPVTMNDDGFEFEHCPLHLTDRAQVLPREALKPPEIDPVAASQAKPSMMVPTDAGFKYLPLWDVRSNSIFCYLCQPYWRSADDEFLVESNLPQLFSDARRVLALDIETLSNSIAEAENIVSSDCYARILIPVHYSTLSDQESATRYIEYCNQHIWSVRDYVYFEVIEPQSSLTQEFRLAVAQYLRPFCCGVMLRVMAGFDDFGQIPKEAILSVGIKLEPDQISDVELTSEFDRFASEAGRCQLYTHVHGLQSNSLSVSAICAGIDYVGSGAIASSLEAWAPDDYHIKPIELYKQMIEKT